jgi:peptidoglycan-associated lipoprotein
MTYLEGLAQRLGNLPGSYSVLVEGHCDERGTIEYNLALGGRRASAVRDVLAGLGVTSVETISKGEEEPVVPNASSEDEHQRNRRAVLRLQCR